jgi:hypothetical protein
MVEALLETIFMGKRMERLVVVMKLFFWRGRRCRKR